MSNILDSLKGYITPELVSMASQHLGESESGISKAIGGLAPTILSGLVSKAGDSNGFASIFSMLNQSGNSSWLDNLGGLIGGGNLAQGDPKDAAGALMGSLFGSKTGGILNLISNFSGVKSSSTSSLMGMVGPLIMGYLSKKIAGDNLNASGLASMLLGQKSNIMGALPAGMGSLLGFADMGGGSVNVPNVPQVDGDGGGFGKWLWPLLLLLGLGGLGYYFSKTGCSKPEMPKVEVKVPAMPNADSLAAAAKNAAGAVAGMFKKKVCEMELNVATTGIEAGLLTFIEDATKPVDKTTWFNFDRLVFETGKATLAAGDAGTIDQLKNMAGILKCFPKVKLKVGGYTDNTGNAAANMKLSQARAESVVAELVKLGVEKARLAAEGYGDQHPVGDNATEEGRAKNRRIAVRVTEK